MNNILIEKKIIDELDTNIYNIEKDEIVIFNIDNSKYNECIFNLEENAYLIINKLYNEKEITVGDIVEYLEKNV